MVIIPGMDITNKKVTGIATNYNWGANVDIVRDPEGVASYWKAQGAERLYIADLDGANNGYSQNLESIKRIIDHIGIRVILGGGIRDEDTVKKVFDIGVEKIVLGTGIALDISFGEKMINKYRENVIVSLGNLNGYVAINDWSARTEEKPYEFAKRMENIGCKYIVYNDVDRKGRKGGPNFDRIKEMRDKAPKIKIIVGCGVSSLDHIIKLKELKIGACIMVTALYTKKVDFKAAVDAGRVEN